MGRLQVSPAWLRFRSNSLHSLPFWRQGPRGPASLFVGGRLNKGSGRSMNSTTRSGSSFLLSAISHFGMHSSSATASSRSLVIPLSQTATCRNTRWAFSWLARIFLSSSSPSCKPGRRFNHRRKRVQPELLLFLRCIKGTDQSRFPVYERGNQERGARVKLDPW